MDPHSEDSLKGNGEANGSTAMANGNSYLSMRTSLEDDDAKCRANVMEWLNNLFPHLKLPLDASDEELRECLIDGSVFYGILNWMNPAFPNEGQVPRLEKVQRFISIMEEIGFPVFEVSDLQQGSMTSVVDCLLALKANSSAEVRGTSSPVSYWNQLRKKWKLQKTINAEGIAHGDQSAQAPVSPRTAEERRRISLELRFQRALRSPVVLEPSVTALHHERHKFHEVFQLRQGRYSDLPPAKILEMLKTASLDSAPTQSLLTVVNGILDESMDKKNGEIPHRVACLLRKVVQEIERRISTQAEHIRNQSNLIKARDEKYLSRIKVLETLANGSHQENQISVNHLQQTKAERIKMEEAKRLGEQDLSRLAKEKQNCDNEIMELKKEQEVVKRTYEERCRQLGMRAMETKVGLEEKLKEVELLLTKSRKKNQELEALSLSEVQNWSKKEHTYQTFLSFQFQALRDVRVSSGSIKKEVLDARKRWLEEFNDLGRKLKGLAEAAQNYHAVLAENRKLYNEVQDLKGNIRVYCRVRPFLPGQAARQSTIEYISADGDLIVANPSKEGKEGHRMFKFNKVFGPTASQAEVFLDTQPLIRSVLDGYNVCIFAYGQTGSGKTYTMTGPEGASLEEWGVNFRALSDLFQISWERKVTVAYEVGVQMVEIYNEQVRDLLSSGGSAKRLGIWSTSQPNGLAVPDASMHPVKSTDDVLELMHAGHSNRSVGATALNVRSSRSHSIVTVHVRGMDLKTGSVLRGSLHLVDLAGSERVERSLATGDRLKEAQHINRSLSALGDVIFALSQKSAHVPYRNSKLTQVLQGSLGGQAKTLMFVQLNPDASSYSETLSTLKFAERVSGVELGAARSSKEGKDVRELIEQVASLKDIIAKKDEEIEHLLLLKDQRSASSNVCHEPQRANSLRHSSSSPHISSIGAKPPKRSRSLSHGRTSAAAEVDNCSDCSDKHSEGSSQQSMEDYRHQKELLGQSKPFGAEFGENSSADVELLGFGDGESEDRLSDISDGGLSMGTEAEGEVTRLLEGVKLVECPNKSKFPTRLPRPPQKSGPLAMSRLAAKESPRVSSKESSKVSSIKEISKVSVSKFEKTHKPNSDTIVINKIY
ncbi:kinesin-like protein KIN-14C isoform X2 [Aristolochia californica]|uniref:kinesin-like protein KIN-14C isoform X2 n=1 Tax=Aristolochia californica TaxID=171875 RepID=UPI0035DDC220